MVTVEIENPTDDVKKAFEIEDVVSRENFVFQIEREGVEILNTSRNINERTPVGYVTIDNIKGMGFKSVREYFYFMYEKSLKDNRMCFLAWVERI